MITPSYSATATERVLPRLALDFTTASLDARVTVTRSLNTATRTNASGILEIVNANLPRFDYDPSTLACKGLLIEEARTNLLLNSLIDGTNLSTQSVTLSAVAYTLSFYGAGSVAISGGHSATVAGTGNYPNRRTYTFTPSAGSTTFTVSGDVKYAQLEAGSFETSFIPTAGASVLRNADVVSMTGTNFSSWFNASEGTISCNVTLTSTPTTAAAFPRVLTIGGANPDTDEISIYTRTQGVGVDFGLPFGGITTADVSQADLNGISSPINNWGAAIAYKANDCAAAGSGTLLGTDNSVTLPACTQLLIMGQARFQPQPSGWVRKINYWPQRLTNAEVQAFSKQG